MLRADSQLSNEELNRCMARVERLSDVPAAAAAVLASRTASDPVLIGPRLYQDDEYGTTQENEQRKAMNPHFLLAGGGGWFIDVEPSDPYRRLPDWARGLLARELRSPGRLEHASTESRVALAMSVRSGAPR
jgi:hypothetical protein